MRPALVGAILPLTLPLLGAAPRAQGSGSERLRKTDVVRLLSSTTLDSNEVATLIRQNCLTFTPSGRDRADFVALGASPIVLRAIDGCVRRAVTKRAPVKPPRADSAPPPPSGSPPLPGMRAPLSSVRSGFVLGLGQHGAAGARPASPLLFELRDTAGLPVRGQEVALTASNGRLDATQAVTDSNGRVAVGVTLGPSVGPVEVRARVAGIERQATLYAEPGPVAQLGVRCGDKPVGRRFTLAPGAPAVLRVTAHDAFGNTVPIGGLQAATGDRGVVRVTFVGAEAGGGLVRVAPNNVGSTSLVIVASGRREDVSVTVAREPVVGTTPCP